jgi:exodeoxyribonuclease VII large subunit
MILATPWASRTLAERDVSYHRGRRMSVDARVNLSVGRGDEAKGVSLAAFLARVKAVVNSGFPEPVWVRAEIRKVQTARSGHVYLELEERDSRAQTIAKTTSVIWKDRFPLLDAKFAEGTGDHLKPDIKVLVRVRAEFHAVHGFDLIIDDIDPSYTLGDLLAKMQRIRVTLTEEGVFGANKALPVPPEYVRVAVISPATSAGEGDFRSEADPLHWSGLCRFDYFTATFQGVEASASIRRAIRAVFDVHKTLPYDALAIIRGGGSMSDLAWLNDLQLARWVCRVPIPVLTGIGHERDSTIVDEIAHRRFDTPSKVALHIARTIRDNAAEAIKNLEMISHHVGRIVARQGQAVDGLRERLGEQTGRAIERAGANGRHRVRVIRLATMHGVREGANALERESGRLAHGIEQALGDAARAIDRYQAAMGERSRARLRLTLADTEKRFQEIALKAAGRLNAAGSEVEAMRERIERECDRRLALARSDLQGSVDALLTSAEAVQRAARTHVEHWVQTIVGLGPEATLRRGYAVARDSENRPIGSKAEAVSHRMLQLQFHDGDVAVENRDYEGRKADE